MNASAAPDQRRNLMDRDGKAAVPATDTESVAHLIARVLHEAHQTASAHKDPHAARVILQVTHSFADELARADGGFERRRFIHAATAEQPAPQPMSD